MKELSIEKLHIKVFKELYHRNYHTVDRKKKQSKNNVKRLLKIFYHTNHQEDPLYTQGHTEDRECSANEILCTE